MYERADGGRRDNLARWAWVRACRVGDRIKLIRERRDRCQSRIVAGRSPRALVGSVRSQAQEETRERGGRSIEGPWRDGRDAVSALGRRRRDEFSRARSIVKHPQRSARSGEVAIGVVTGIAGRPEQEGPSQGLGCSEGSGSVAGASPSNLSARVETQDRDILGIA
jgi:hypothetical protein